jgi:hypothetical protein
MWTLLIIPFALNYHMLRVHLGRLELPTSTLWIWLCNNPYNTIDHAQPRVMVVRPLSCCVLEMHGSTAFAHIGSMFGQACRQVRH